MIKKQFTGSARRARNIIWNAAARYDFEPPFMAFFASGKPDDYFNMIVGFVEKWLDMPRIWAFFDSYGGDRRAAEFDELLWLGLENCVYEKEVAERPLLETLRRRRAERFYEEQKTLSRQQMEYQSMLAYTQQEARWSAVCGRRGPLLSPREKRMAQSLCLSGTLDTDGVLDAMRAFLQTFFRFTPDAADGRPRRAGALARALLRREHRRQDRLIVRTGTGEGDHERAVQQRHEGLGRYAGPTEADSAFIREAFGRSILSEKELRILENDLCTGRDENCRLWVTRGDDCADKSDEIRQLREDSLRQKTRNESFLREHAPEIQSAVRALSTRIDTVFESYRKHLPEPARAGRMRPDAAYRLPVLNDPRVFLRDGEETETEICVDLLLDASQSRMNVQETVSAEAYIIAESLRKLHVPVRVTCFRSIRGYTVLDVLKDWNAKDCRGLSRYYAAGWNRDGLALETLGRLDDDQILAGKRRLLLILTDASPNDSAPLAAQGLRQSREYEGAAAVKAAEDAVRMLRNGGLRVGAVFHGNTAHLDDLHQIYGHACVRIRKASQLAQGVSDLLLMLLREMRED